MLVVGDGLATHVAHVGPAHTRHLVTPVHLVELLPTVVARPHHGFGHLVLDEGAHLHLVLLLHLVTAQRDVGRLLTQSGEVGKVLEMKNLW